LITMTSKEHDNGQNCEDSSETAQACSFAHLHLLPAKQA
jgi:hypothetical protein